MNPPDLFPRRRRLDRWLLLAASSLALLACQAPAPRDPEQPAPTPAAPAPIAFDDAILKAAKELLAKAQLPLAGGQRQALLIDPLVDGVTGSQSLATRSMEQRLVEIVRRDYPQLEVQAFSTSNLAGQPLVLVGTLTPINNSAGQPSGERDAFRICLALADLKSGKVIAKGVARARPDGVQTTPLPFDADSPAWTRDAAIDGYIRTCQGSKAGDPINPVYVARIMAAALLNDAGNAYNGRRYQESLELYRRALDTAGGDQLRAHNGAYLAAWKLKRRDEATQAFARLVDHGLASRQLALKFLFRPGSTQFIHDAQISGPYPMWLNQIARRSVQNRACLEIVGHTSRSGPEPINQRLSVLRAQAIKDRLDGSEPQLIRRTVASGVGSRENLVGTGTDDAGDALDRRVEFRVLDC
ncbi:OmpA family protein [Accumulibacter sp.]|uniref:OmpA family protein n=1 Tax=Accumulibacter sp. TaxID=2053492 RepID=UPI0025E93A5F|nr:OmpA family protein [Accumulibacter sp.]MCM8613724.1 OmpA family protein [Accumulibacter sp.]MCM8637380.1 OmpA family protein [Accumulibacter sp.]MCM8640904.1 OmpA family protein [Accumulibacter sp.]